MEHKKEWNIDWQLTSKINIPGLSIVKGVETDADYFGVYRPQDVPHCPKCGWEGQQFGYYVPRTVWHVLSEHCDEQLGVAAHPKIITIQVQNQRYKCPSCSNVIPYEIGYAPKGASTTAELNDYIGRQLLDRSPQKVAHNVGLKQDTVTNIFNRWAAEQLTEYEGKLIAPKELGLHLIEIKGVPYYLVTDVKDSFIIDIFQKNDFAGVIDRLTRLAYVNNTTDVLTEIDRIHVATVRGVFRTDAIVRAAVASIYRSLANDIISEMAQRYTGRGMKAISSWLLTPLDEDPPIEPEVNRVRKQGSLGRHGWLCSALDACLTFRTMALQSWNKSTFDDWLVEFKTWCFSPPNLLDALNYAKDVIDHSFDSNNDILQKGYINTEAQATDVILRNQKCSFDLLRKRLLLTCSPQIAGRKTVMGMKYYYRGISLAELSATLKEYED